MGHNTAEATKNIYYAKSEDTDDHSKVSVHEILFGFQET